MGVVVRSCYSNTKCLNIRLVTLALYLSCKFHLMSEICFNFEHVYLYLVLCLLCYLFLVCILRVRLTSVIHWKVRVRWKGSKKIWTFSFLFEPCICQLTSAHDSIGSISRMVQFFISLALCTHIFPPYVTTHSNKWIKISSTGDAPILLLRGAPIRVSCEFPYTVRWFRCWA